MAAQSKPKPLEEVSGGDLSEVKKDPIWKTWFKEKGGDWAKLSRMMGEDAYNNWIKELHGDKDESPAKKKKPSGGFIQDLDDPEDVANKAVWKTWLKEKKRSGKGRRRVKLDEQDEEEEDAWMPLTKRQGEKVGYKPEHESIRESEGAGQAHPQTEQFERSRPNVKRIQEQPKGVRSTGTSELPESKGEEVYPRGTVHVLPEVKDGIQTGKPAKDIHGKKIYTHVGGSPTGEKTKPLPKEEKRGYKDKPVPKKHTSNLPKNRKRFNYKKSESFVYKIWLMKEKPKKDEGQTQQEPKGAMGALRKKPVTYGTSIGTGLGEGEKQHEVKPKEDYKENYKPQAQVSSRAFQTGKPKLQGDKVDLKEHHAGLKRLVGRLRTGKWGRQASTGSNPKDIEGSGGNKNRKTPPTGAAPERKVKPTKLKPKKEWADPRYPESEHSEGDWQKKLVAERTASQKAGKKRVRLGDTSSLQKLPKKKPSKYKDPQEMSKYPKKPVMGKGQQVKYKAWLADKGGLGALGEGKLNRYTGKPKKLRYNPQRDLDDYPSEKQIDEKARKKREAKEKTDYFVEEIKMNIVYEDKIAPLLGAVAGAVGRGAMAAGRGLARGVKDNAGKMGEFAGGMMEGLAGDEEKMEEEQ